MRSILITGANGFVGKALKSKLKKSDYHIVEFEGNILDAGNYEKLANHSFSHCFHLAAKTFVPDSWSNPSAFIESNVMGTGRVLKFCHEKKIPLTFLSSYLYGTPENLPIAEDDPIKPNNPYALSKHLAEGLCKFYATFYGLKVTVIRPFNIYGPNQNDKFLIPSLIHQALHSQDIRVKDLKPKRDYVFIDDLIEAMILTIHYSEHYSVFNIASGNSISVKEVIDTIQQVTKTDKVILSEEVERPNEIADTIASIELAKSNLGWAPKYSFKEGITEILRIYESTHS